MGDTRNNMATTLHVIPHTHWDREWYLPFQSFRFRLVGLVDRLLDLMERDPDYRFFTLDGQTIVLDDYLEIRPEAEPRLRRLVQDGRLAIGPWYILPDEFLAGPEAMVRNLLWGERGCRRFTAERQPMERIGYLPDPFGHISQLPQIAREFGMEALCFWRGVGDAPTEFRWASPDGSERLVLHLRDSYGNGAWLAPDEDGFIKDLAGARDALAPHATTSHLLVMQGTDHMEPRPDLPARLRGAEIALNHPVVHSTLPAYLEAVRTELGNRGLEALPLIQGELRSPQRAHLLPAVLSARMWIKQWNARCETLLTRWAEPFAALAEQATGSTPHRGALRKAWEWLLKNQPHDSICGCSTDQVHDEMRTRFAWCEQIAEQVTQASLETIANEVNTEAAESPSQQGDWRLLVFNPTAFTRTDRVRIHLRPAPAGDWRILDAAAVAVPCRLVSRAAHEQLDTPMDRATLSGWLDRIEASDGNIGGDMRFHHLRKRIVQDVAFLEVTTVAGTGGAGQKRAMADHLNRARSLVADEAIQGFHVRVVEDLGAEVEFLARDIPSFGYAQFVLREAPDATAPPRPPAPPDTPLAVENEFFAIEANPADGTVTVTDKLTGLVLRGANRLVDGGDRGDEYTYCRPENDLLVDRPAAPPTIRKVEDGVGSALEIKAVYHLPCALAAQDRSRRSSDLVEVPITSRASLTPGTRRIEFETTVHNRAEDHRLRVHFPTPVVTHRSWADGHFDVVDRPIALPRDTEGWAEQPSGAHPQLTFADVSDGKVGVLLANRGLPEYEVLPATDGEEGVTLALTLLRCVGWLSRGDLHNRDGHAGPAVPTPGAQCAGEHTFHYALAPHSGNYLTASREAHAFNAPLRALRTTLHDSPLPASTSFLQVSPAAVVVSAIKPPEAGEGMILRLYNSAATPVVAHIRLLQRFEEASRVPMSEAGPMDHLARDSDRLDLPLRAREIATLRLELARVGKDGSNGPATDD
jgi:alpha-mannosidase